MARPEFADVVPGQQAWDEPINANASLLRDFPTPLARYFDSGGTPLGDETQFVGDFDAANYEHCSMLLEHSTLGLVLATSNGTSWVYKTVARAAAVADFSTPSTATAEDCANKINDLLASLRAAGMLEP